MKIYEMRLTIICEENGKYNREYNLSKKAMNVRNNAPLFVNEIAITKYLKLNPDKFKDHELEIESIGLKNGRDDIEHVLPEMELISPRFKEFAEKENLPFDFFPVLADGERRYLMMWRNLPVISDFEVDIEKSKYFPHDLNRIAGGGNMFFRSDFLEYYNFNIFCYIYHTYTFITDSLKQKLEIENFKLTFEEKPVTQKKLDKKEIINDLIFARQKERESYIDRKKSEFARKRYKQFEQVDDFLEEILAEEGNKDVLAKFYETTRGEWKKDFERFDNGEMGELEKIRYW